MTVETLAIVAAVLFGAMAVFQLALAAGAPLGHIAYGGRFAEAGRPLPGRWRVSSAVAAVVLIGFAWVILARGGAVATGLDDTVLAVLAWIVTAYMAINTAANLAARHPIERFVLGGVTGVLTILCAIVAAAGPG